MLFAILALTQCAIKPKKIVFPQIYRKYIFDKYFHLFIRKLAKYATKNDDEEGIHVSFDYKFPWERNGEINWGKIGQIAGDVIDVMGTKEFKKLVHDITGNADKEVKINKRIYDLFASQKLPLLIKLYKVYKQK